MKTRFWNIANTISILRIFLLLVTIYFFFSGNFYFRFTSIILVVILIYADFLDGYFARKYNVDSKFGGVIDVMVDRIIENVFWISLALLSVVPAWAPILIVIRGISTDAFRSIALTKGKGTFEMMGSKLGYIFVKSRVARGFNNVLKTAVFTLGAVYLTYQIPWMLTLLFWLTVCAVAFSLIRGSLEVKASAKYYS